jgi:hypothetical protein
MITKNQLKALFNPRNLLPPIIFIIKEKIISFFIKKNILDPWIDKPVNYKKINHLFKDKVVLNGPFIGMKYPKLESNGSSLYPKLLGSYEKEIQDLIYKLINNNYSKIVDIGSAEGYYAVGFALKSPKSIIMAFDSDSNALDNCKKMAKHNNVLDRVQLSSWCSKEILLKEDLKNSLIISDCEGYEKQLFLDKNIVKHLKDTTLLIETHDHVDINISTKLKSYFSNSHKVESIYSLDDFLKLKNYEFSCLKDFDLRTKKEITFEGRGYIQEWLILYPKQSL